MEVKKEGDKTIKTIVPIRGNILEKLKNKFKSNIKNNASVVPTEVNDTLNNNHNGQPDPVIKNEVQSQNRKVIIQSVEKVQIDLSTVLQPIAQTDHQFTALHAETPQQEKVSLKVLSATFPENDYNKVVPLKVVRTMRPPKAAPNLQLKRFGSVQVHRTQSSPVLSIKAPEEVQIQKEPEKPQIIAIASFKGFTESEKSELITGKLKLWGECLKMSDDFLKILFDRSKVVTPELSETTKTYELPSTSQIITDSMVNSSMMREFAKDLDPTLLGDMSSMDTEDDYMDDSSDTQDDAEMDADQAQWLMDIDDLIGGPRIKEIDKSLKKIPTIVTGNKIQTENVELKLIVNHLLKKLHAQTVYETLNTAKCDDEISDHFDDNVSVHNFDNNEQLEIPETKSESNELSAIVKEQPAEEQTIIETKIVEEIEIPKEAPLIIETEIVEEVETPKEARVEAIRKRKAELYPLATSTVKKMKPGPNFDLIDMDLEPSTSSQVDEKPVIANLNAKRGRTRLQTRTVVEKPKRVEVVKRARGRPKVKQEIEKAPPSSARRKSKLVSCDVVSDKPLCKPELKSIDLNSPESAVITYQDYPNSPSSPLGNREKHLVVQTPLVEKVNEVVNKQKVSDPTFRAPEQAVKRPYLRTSAFKGNHNNESDTDSNSEDSAEDSHSVSNDPQQSNNEVTPIIENDQKNISLKELMNSLIDGKKSLIEKSMSKPKVPRKKVKKKPVSRIEPKRRLKEHFAHPKKVFEQETLEKADEKKVPYDQIIECIRISNPPRAKESGKALWTGRSFTPEEMKSLFDKLKKQKYFRCGSCQYLVTKHKWKQHLESHGVYTYVDGFETPLNPFDWNESLRRIIQYCRIYKIDSLTCPNCRSVKKSPLGQMSHFFVCGEDQETLEAKKIQCDFCECRVMPFSMSMHKKTCKGLQMKIEPVKKSDSENEDVVHSSGRAKRKAVQKAEKKLTNILKKLSDDRAEHVGVIDKSGRSQCNLCSQVFETKELTLTHIENVHNVHGNDDFGSSSSDDYGGEKSESSETDDESSGVDENEESSESNLEDDDNSNIVTFAEKGKKSMYETEELKYSRTVVQDYSEELRQSRLSSKLIELNQEFIEEFLSEEIFPNLAPIHQISKLDIRSFLNQIQFKMQSINCVSSQVNRYLMNFEESNVSSAWKQLNVGTPDSSDSNHILFYTGGSVSSMDWAPTNEESNNFLAVACNPHVSAMSLSLRKTIKSCVQIYEFETLVNQKFQNFQNITSTLLYTFDINDGPIWCVKFHPCGYPSSDRIGILAVTTSTQDVFIFSLPYLNSNNKSPQVVMLEPNFICRLHEESILYEDEFLMQVTRVCWHYQKNLLNYLAVGYVNGYVALWNFEGKQDDDEIQMRFPDIVIQAHRESITALDVKPGQNGQFFLLTSCNGREIKMYSIENCRYQEVTYSQPASRTLCAQLWSHWAGYVIGNDSAYAPGVLVMRQPFDFANKNTSLMSTGTSIIHMDIDHWTNTVIFTTDAGDVLTVCPHKLINTNPKDKWNAFGSAIESFTDYKKIPQSNGSPAEIGIVFADMKSNGYKKPRSFREPPVELTNQLQINHVSFNRNEKSHHFYALGYETGFVRIRHLKTSK